MSVVTINNPTSSVIHYSLKWGNGAYKDYTVNPGQYRLHWITGQNVKADDSV